MLDLHNILWVIPGVFFIYFYNKRRPDDTISLSGWPYFFFVVVIAFFTWLPAEFITQFLCMNIEILNENQNKLLQLVIITLISLFFTFIMLLFAQLELIADLIFLPVYDNFFQKCIEWENEEILLTLKNGKAYHSLLWQYPENPKSRHESQTVSIIPFKSGYRDDKTKKIIWNIYYPEYIKKSDILNMELIIPRTEIITFGKFNDRVFKYFYSDEKSQKGS